MRFRKLRIAFSAVSFIPCALLVAVWVRSCWRFDQIIHRTSAAEYMALTSLRGKFAFGGSNDPRMATVFNRDWMYRGFAMKEAGENAGSPIPVFPTDAPESVILFWPQYHNPSVLSRNGSTSYELSLPYWLLVLTTAAFGTVASFPWRFSLRTLLIATTLIAVALG